ncbi:GFA family protein [Motiliproteus sediminis]|uniref:GFA family protein n=1 Tax=Motiliproteus sediminis TaxID=1468178 RepID=UPI001AEF5559|nr:GFA family protein [Motiliproteus sediminis]
MAEALNGQCLCGQVRYRIKPPLHQFHLCHCSRCQRSTGSAHAANLFADPDAIEWLQGETACRRFDLPEARFFSRCFCTHCGSPVPCLARNGKLLTIPAGGLTDPVPCAPQDHIFWEDRCDWYDQAVDESCPRFAIYPDQG